ncbi:restriction endonuclease subunit S [Selenomonas montiformis]|uniref:restriction endonuclease subunit S n=1 Tax=Selenomonas montiformis TaxID=2652285 RepID=UPI003F9E7995
MMKYNFGDVFEDVTKKGTKIPRMEYLAEGKYPVIDQGKEFIGGYTDNYDGIFNDVPAIIFGDHTRILKYVDTPFFIGADGVKILAPKLAGANCKYLYYALQKVYVPDTGYNRHFKWLKEADIVVHDVNKQNEIVGQLDLLTSMMNKHQLLLDRYDELVKSRFVEMFGDPVVNTHGWEKTRLADKCDIVTGNTPSRKVKEYYGSNIEWIKSDNITDAKILTTATEYLSEKGEEVGRTVEAGSILMTCIAGSLRSIGNVAIADRKVAFNQQINAIIPNEQNTHFMYEQFRLSKDYICSGVNMALKGILSKGQLSEIEFVFPPIDLQKQFADFAAQADKSKLTIQKSMDNLREMRDSLLQEYFG